MGFLLVIPLFLIRFGLLYAVSKDALARAARFAPLAGREKIAYGLYQISNVALIVYPCFLSIKLEPPCLFDAGAVVYGAGVVLLAVSTVQFAHPSPSGLVDRGVYRLSRNPMYVAYPLCFAGMALMTCSMALMALTFAFQASARWIVRAEERECARRFGDEYARYAAKVRRWL